MLHICSSSAPSHGEKCLANPSKTGYGTAPVIEINAATTLRPLSIYQRYINGEKIGATVDVAMAIVGVVAGGVIPYILITFGSHNVAFDELNLDKLHKLAQAKIPAPGDNLKRRKFEYSNPLKELASIINPMLKAGDPKQRFLPEFLWSSLNPSG